MSIENVFAGAVVAAGPAPLRDTPQYTTWLNTVADISEDLNGLLEDIRDHETRRQECIETGEKEGTKKSFYGKLVAAKPIKKGTGEKTVTKGYLQFQAREDSQSVDEEGYEHIETPPLSTPEGQFEFRRAKTLVGRDVIVYKRIIPLPNGRRARECSAIDPARTNFNDMTPAVSTPAPQATTPTSPTAPPAQPTPETNSDTTPENTSPPTVDIFADSTPKETTTNTDLTTMTPTTEQELSQLAEKYLGKTSAEIRTLLVEKFNVPENKKLPARQYTAVWQELVAE